MVNHDVSPSWGLGSHMIQIINMVHYDIKSHHATIHSNVQRIVPHQYGGSKLTHQIFKLKTRHKTSKWHQLIMQTTPCTE